MRGTQLAALCAVMIAVFTAVTAAGAAVRGSDDSGLSALGVTLYGTVDIGLQFETHGVPASDYYVAGTAAFIRSNDQRSVFAATPNNLGQSAIGLSGREPLASDWTGIFKLEVFFNPQSGQISDGLKSLTLNNGKAVSQQTTGLDSSLAGEPFETASIGLHSPRFGTLLFGRMLSLLGEGVANYDPQQMSATFSLLGAQGTATGGGDTEDRRIDSFLKYQAEWRTFHFGVASKVDGISGTPTSALQFNFGAAVYDGSLDAFYSRIRGAISASSLSIAEVNALPAGLSPNNAVAATVSDNTTVGLLSKYEFGQFTVYAGYEYIRFKNPDRPLAAGIETIGGYTLAFVNNAAYDAERQFQIFWTGARYAVRPYLDLSLAYYGYRQNGFATGALSSCATSVSPQCSGAQLAVSGSAVWHLSKRFDSYAGAMYSGVRDGLASGYLHTSLIASTVGLRFRF